MPFATVPTSFEWPAGPNSVQVSGDWDKWSDKLELKRSADGSFKAELDLPEKTKFNFKFIIDGVWQTKQGFPTERDDSNNENNVLTTGEAVPSPAPAPAKSDESAPCPVAAAAPAAAAAAAKVQPVDIPENSVPNTPAISSEAAWPTNPSLTAENSSQSTPKLSSSPDKPSTFSAATAAGGIAGASAGAAGIAAMFGTSPDKSSLDLVRGQQPAAKKVETTTPAKAAATEKVAAAPDAPATDLTKAPGAVPATVAAQVAGKDAGRTAPPAVVANGKKEATPSAGAAPKVSGAPAAISKASEASEGSATKVSVSGAPAGAAAASAPAAKASKPVAASAAAATAPNTSTDSAATSGHAKGSSTAASSATAVSTSGGPSTTTTETGKEKEKRGSSIFGTISRSRRKSAAGLFGSEAEHASSNNATTNASAKDVPPVPAVPKGVATSKASNGSSVKAQAPVAPAPAAAAPVTPKKAAPVPASSRNNTPAATAQTPEKKSGGSGFLSKLKKGLTPKKGGE